MLNLAEGSAQPTHANRRRFYSMAFGSLREVQAIADLSHLHQIRPTADRLGGQLYQLLKSKEGSA